MKRIHKIIALSLVALIVLGGIIGVGATWLRAVGLLEHHAVIFANDATSIDKTMANVFNLVFGDRVRICSGSDDNDTINTVISKVNTDGGGSVLITPGTYYLGSATDDHITLLSNVNVECSPNTIIDASSMAGGASSYIWYAHGTPGSQVDLSADANAGDSYVSISNTSSFTVGGLVQIGADVVWRSNDGGVYQGEYKTVADIDAGQYLNFDHTHSDTEGRLVDTYTTTNGAFAQSIDAVENIKVIGNGALIIGNDGVQQFGFWLEFGRNIEVAGFQFQELTRDACVAYVVVNGGSIHDCYSFCDYDGTNNAYGVAIGQCQGIDVYGNRFKKHFAGITIGSSYTYYGISRFIDIHDNWLEDCDYGIGSHWSHQFVKVHDNTVVGGEKGLTYYGYAGEYYNNTIIEISNVGIDIAQDDTVQEGVSIHDNVFYNVDDQAIYIRTPNCEIYNNRAFDCGDNAYVFHFYEDNIYAHDNVAYNPNVEAVGYYRVDGDKITLKDNLGNGSAGGYYGVYFDSGSSNILIDGNDISDTTSSKYYNASASTNVIFRDNADYIGKGEKRELCFNITAGVQNTVTSVQNTYQNILMIVDAYVAITTPDPDDSPTYDMGIDDDGSGAPSSGNNLFEAIPDTSAGYYSATNSTEGQLTDPVVWLLTGSYDWVNFIITDDDGDGVVGTIHLIVVGI